VYCTQPRNSCTIAADEEAAIRNRSRFNRRWAIASWLLVALSPAGAAELEPQAARGFDEYVRLTALRMQGELAAGGVFLRVDGLPEDRRKEAYARLQRGEVVSERLHTYDPAGNASTPGALVHHWMGTVFIPGVSVGQVLALVEDYDRHAEYYQPDVMQSKKVAQNGENFKVHYLLEKKKIITIVLDTDYDVHRHFLDAAHAYSDSVSTRIAQVENAGLPDQHELPPGRDGGYLWRLNSYWRFFDSGHGVYVQCEAISLTRDIPAGLNWLVGSFVESIPRESLDFTLQSTRAAVLHDAQRTGH
jgi:hypothetical protein